MGKVIKDNAENATAGYGLGDARAAFDRQVGSWFPIAWRIAVFYGTWITLAYVAMGNMGSPQGTQIAAIAFWFGWLFLGATLLLGVVVTVASMVDRFKLSRHKRKY